MVDSCFPGQCKLHSDSVFVCVCYSHCGVLSKSFAFVQTCSSHDADCNQILEAASCRGRIRKDLMLEWYEQRRRHDMPLRPGRILYNSRPRLDNRLDQHPCRRHSSSSSRCNSYRDVLLFGSEHFQHHVPEAGYENQKGLILPFFVCMHGAFQFAWSHLGLALCDWFPPTFTPVCSCHDCGRQEA